MRRIFGALLGDIEKESETVKQDAASHLAATVVSVSNNRVQKRFCPRIHGPTALCRRGHERIKAVVWSTGEVMLIFWSWRSILPGCSLGEHGKLGA